MSNVELVGVGPAGGIALVGDADVVRVRWESGGRGHGLPSWKCDECGKSRRPACRHATSVVAALRSGGHQIERQLAATTKEEQ